jgi:hypothetical protein
MGSPFQQFFFEVLHEEIGNHRGQGRSRGYSIGLFVELPVETEKMT